MSVIESLLNLPTRQITDNICRFCQKTFCCTKCRDRHVDKVHPNLNVNCVLCASKKMPMRQFEFEKLLSENKTLLAHIADEHLPLHCVLCEDLFETSEDLKSIGACKRYSEYRRVLMNQRLPGTPAPTSFEVKLKRNVNDNSHVFFTPPEIYRNTSTPMFVGQKSSFEFQTPHAPNFSLKTPKTNSPSIARSNATSKTQQSQNSDSDIKFFSFSPNTNEGTTPFRSNADDQFPRSNSGRKLVIKEPTEVVCDEAKRIASHDDQTAPSVNMNLTTPFKSKADEQLPRNDSDRKLDIKEEPSETVHNGAEEVALYDDYTTSPVDTNPTDVKDNIPQDHTPKLNVGKREESGRASDVVKKVRFSDQYDTLSEFGNQAGFCVRNTLNTTEEDNDVFHDARDASGVKSTKSTKNMQNKENTNDTNDSKNTNAMRDTKEDIKKEDTEENKNENVENIKDVRNDRVDDQERAKSSKDSSDNTEINISQENRRNTEKENRAAEASSNDATIATQKGTSRVLMMVLVENNPENTDLMPLINSGLKKIEEQIGSSGTSGFSGVNSADFTKRCVTKVEMSVSNIESYSNNNSNNDGEVMRDHQQGVSTLPSSSNSKTSSNSGILSTVAQAMRSALKNLSGLRMGGVISNVVQQQIVEDAISLPETSVSCNLDNSLEIRYGKRARDVNEVSSWVDPVPVPPDIRSPLPKRKRERYKIKGRRPIRSVRNRKSEITSPRGVSSETQFFSQGSLTVGDTVLPLPARAYPEVPLAPDE